ncbi:MAG: hypothetical protein GQ527_12510 [Bacteroidales bacterium]|nr:hypothetical protein [Bacteroidales bacterium]
MTKPHTFHIPVMGIGFTIDTPLKVSHYGIDSVISLVDDILLEKLRKMYSEKFEIPYHEISDKIDDFRAKRITSYLNLINSQAEKKFDELKNAASDKSNEIKEYFSLLPDSSEIKQEFDKLTSKYFNLNEIKTWMKDNLSRGSIDVNIMTKVDKDNYRNGEQLPVEYNDAHAALRGYANSDLSSSIVLSAGMNPRLYNYMENFEDFYPNEKGEIKKKIILKVSDYRSALIQGKYLAKKGLWVSEYRIESGLNCGGHAFATDGNLLGPVLAEFKTYRDRLTEGVNEIYMRALKNKERALPLEHLKLTVTAQGGVGTAEEHEFLMDHYGVDSVGWGTPFLLVPEATSVDKDTREQLRQAKEKDLFLSGISPLGVPFNNLRNNTKDLEKESLIKKGKPGSLCPNKFVKLNTELTKKAICTASYQFQRLKIKALDTEDLSPVDYQNKYEKIVEKSCVCVGLGISAMIAHDISTEGLGDGVSVCPGPNLAYYDKELSLKEMISHIYGKTNIISRTDRPNMFVKELNIYIDFLKGKIEETTSDFNKKQEKYLSTFAANLQEGINYYQNLFTEAKGKFEETKTTILNDLDHSKEALKLLHLEINHLSEKLNPQPVLQTVPA